MDRKAFDETTAMSDKRVAVQGHGEVPIDPPSRRGRERVYLDDLSYLPIAETDALAVIFADD